MNQSNRNHRHLQVIALLASAGMLVSVTAEPSTTLASDTVISQSPAAGEKVGNGTKVSLVVSSGANGGTTVPETTTIPTSTVTPTPTPAQHYVTVPNVKGQGRSTAEARIRKAGLTPAVTTAASTNVPKGSVISQFPAAKASVVANTTVTLTISTGKPPPAPVVMPNLGWNTMSQAAALKKLKALPLKYTVLKQEQFDATGVVGQYPPAGTSLTRNSTVLVVVATKPTVASTEVTSVPNVTYASSGYSISTSEATLKGHDLDWQPFHWSGAESGRVFAQVPDTGTLPKGSKVVLITR